MVVTQILLTFNSNVSSKKEASESQTNQRLQKRKRVRSKKIILGSKRIHLARTNISLVILVTDREILLLRIAKLSIIQPKNFRLRRPIKGYSECVHCPLETSARCCLLNVVRILYVFTILNNGLAQIACLFKGLVFLVNETNHRHAFD